MGKTARSTGVIAKLTSGSLVPINQAIQAINDETDPSRLADVAKALEAAKLLDGKNRERCNYWGTLAIYSNRRLGQTIKQGQAEGWIGSSGQTKKHLSDGLTALSDIVPNRDYAHRCYKLADLPEDLIEEYIATTIEHGDDVTKAGAIRYASPATPHVANNSGEQEWYTPPEFIEAARSLMGSIDTDPASSETANETVKAGTYYTVSDNGLEHDWHGNVWMNPPYGQPVIAEFCSALVEKFTSKEISQACVLVNNATETAWFQELLSAASGVCLLRGRISFLDVTGEPAKTPLQGQAFLYFGNRIKRFTQKLSSMGVVLYVA